MANSSTQGNVGQASGHAHNTTATGLKYRSTNSGQPLAHADVDNNFEILRKAINGVVSDIDAVVKTDVPTGAVFTDTTYNAVTDSVSGLMTGAMKQKLDGIASGAEVNVQSNWNATSGDAQILNKPTIVNTAVTTSANGLMTAADKVKLDGIQAGATAGGGGGASVTTDPTAPSNPSDGDLWFNENEAELYVYTASLGAWIQTNGGGGGGSSGDGHIWRTVSEGSAPLLIDNRILFAPQCHGTNNHSRLYASDLNGVVTQSIINGSIWPHSAAQTGTAAALRTSMCADWESATSSNVDVYVSYPSSYVLKIPFNRSTQTFGNPVGYGVHGGGGNTFAANWKIAAIYTGGTSKHFIAGYNIAHHAHTTLAANDIYQMEYLSTGTGGYFNLQGVQRFLGDMRPLMKSPDGNQLCASTEVVYASLCGVNHVTGKVYYRGQLNGFLYVFQINPAASGNTYAEKLWNMATVSNPASVNSNLTYYKTIMLPTTGSNVQGIMDTQVHFDENGNETGVSYGGYYHDTQRHNVDMGILEWNSAWN